MSYNEKHNEANGEGNRDGAANNLSWNCGVEGPTDDPAITELRERQMRNLLATLLLSQGVPMLLAGDEIGRTQRGNNNAYCQDNEISWVDWALDPPRLRLLDYARRMIALRRDHPVFRRRHFFQGRSVRGSGEKDIAWLTPDGTEMSDEEWNNNFARCLGVFLGGEALQEVDERGRRVVDDSFLLLFNAHHDAIPFKLPDLGAAGWLALVDTAFGNGLAARGHLSAGRYLPTGGAQPGPSAAGPSSWMKRRHSMPFGAELTGDGTRFRLWAPAAARIDVELDVAGRRERRALQALEGGWFELFAEGIGAGARYAYRIDGGQQVPDPASRCNPDDVHRASMVVDPGAYDWIDANWGGRRWEEAVIYELHVGTFTPEGTFAAARERLDGLCQLGITAIELMPLADFPGRRNWGYDGVLLFAPESSYGTPEELKSFVDAAHQLGMMVLLDVVYNHFGPEGNYLHALRTAILHRATRDTMGRRDQLRRTRQPHGARLLTCTTRCTGSRSSTSTGCGSMQCMRSSTTASSTSSANSLTVVATA